MEYENLLEIVKNRRSIRKFNPEPIPDEYVDKIIEAARWAPSGANSQPWEFLVIRKPELRDKIVEFIHESEPLGHKMELVREPEMRFRRSVPGYVRAPVLIIMAGDPRTKDAYPLSAKISKGESNFISGLAISFTYMQLAAVTLGLASQWVSAIGMPYVQSLTKELLGVPEELVFYDMLALGYTDAAFVLKPRSVRPREEIVHYDGYDKAKYRTDQQVQDFIADLRGSRPTN